jgi:hypothetical protein
VLHAQILNHRSLEDILLIVVQCKHAALSHGHVTA